MKILRLLTFAAILGVALVGCRKELPTTIDSRDRLISSWGDAFEAYWDGMNHNYSFWDVDPTDWDKVYVDYKPKFANLKLNDPEDDKKAIALFDELSSTLIDHHMDIKIKTASMAEPVFLSPCDHEIKKRSYYHKRYDKTLLYNAAAINKQAGRITNLLYGEQNVGEPYGLIEMLSYLIDGDVAYMTFTDFAISTAFRQDPQGEIAQAYGNFLEIIKQTPGLRGIIVDVRQNGGGSVGDFNFVVSPLIDKPYVFGYVHTKSGLGRLDYAPWLPMEVQPILYSENSLKVPIVALVDLHSVSMAEMSSMAIQTLPNGHVIGERTWGGHGPLEAIFQISYAGSYDVGNAKIISVRTSTYNSKNLDDKCLEGIGVTPDLEVLLDMEAMNNGVDNQLERALKFIHTGN